MRKNKKIFVLLLGLIMACVFALVACQPTVDPVQLVNFDDVTWTAELGQTYALPASTAFDTKDNDYRVTYTVKTKSGNDVTVSSNQFVVADMGGYVVTCTTETLPDGTVKTRTITLNVEDKSAPDIQMGTAGFGYVGKEFKVPEIVVTDLSGETITPEVKAYKIDGTNETEVAVTNGKFTPDAKGTYLIKVSATDSSNNTATKEVEVLVRNAMAPYVLEDFSDEYALSTITCVENTIATEDPVWMEEYEGKAGVGSTMSTLNAYGPHLFVRLNDEIKTAEFEYVYARVYVKSTIAEYRPTFEAFTWNHGLGSYPVNEWVEVRLNLSDINSTTSIFASDSIKQENESNLETFRRSMTEGYGQYLFWIPMRSYVDGEGQSQNDSPSNYTIYFDEIGYKPYFTPSLDVKEEYVLGETTTLNASVNAQLDASTYSFAYTVTDPSGNAVTLDGNNAFRMVESGEYTVKVDFVHSEYSGTATYTLTVVGDKEITIGEFTGTPSMGDTVTVPTGTIDGATVSVSVRVNGENVPMDGNTFVAGVAGTYEVVYAAEIDGLIYKSVLEIEVDHAFADNEVLGFNRVEDVENVVFGSPNYNVEWMPVYDGENGVIKIDYSGSDWPWMSFIPVYQMATYEDGAYIIIRAKVVSGGNALMYMVLGNDMQVQSRPEGYNNTVTYDEWADYKFDITPFLTFWTDGTLNDSKARLWFQSTTPSATGTIYVSDIYVQFGPALSGITVNVDGEKYDGEEITVTMDVPNGITGAQMVVKNPNGEVVTLTDNKFTAVQGTYTIEITCDGYPGVWKQTFEIAEALGVIVDSDLTIVDGTVEIPTITVTDLSSKENVTANAEIEVKVTYGGTELVITDNKFMAGMAGIYQVIWTVTYEGKRVEYSESVLVEGSDEVQPNEVEFFSSISSLDRVEMGTTIAKNYVMDAPAGATHGSVAFDISQVSGSDGNNWPRLAVPARQAKSAYADADAITLTLKFVGKEGANVELVFWSDNSERKTVQLNTWTTVVVSKEKFLANFDNLGILDEAKGWFWFTNIGSNTVQKVIIHEIKVTKKIKTEDALLDLSSEQALLSVLSSGTTEYVNAGNIAMDSNLPALPDGENAYLKLAGTGDPWGFFNVVIAPMSSKEAFVSADTLEFKVYTHAPRTLYFYNSRIANIPANTWTTISLPVSVWTSTKHANKVFTSADNWYDALVDGDKFISFAGVSGSEKETMYMTSVRYVDYAVDETLGNNYAHISTSTVSVNNGTVAQGNYFGKDAVKITSTDTWVNVFVKPGKNEKELAEYTKAILSVYLEGAEPVRLYSQFQRNGEESQHVVFYGYAQPGQWVDIEVPVERIIELYPELHLGTNAFFIDQGKAFTALYISSITLYKSVDVSVQITEGTLNAGDEVTVTLINEKEITDLTMVVTDEDGNEVTLENGKFIAEEGKYTVTVSKEGYESYVMTFIVYSSGVEIAENEVLAFTSASDIKKVDMGENEITSTVTWLEEFEGKEGVAKFEFSGGSWPYMGFGTNQEMNAYADYDYLTVTLYAPSAGNSLKYLKLGANTGKDTWPIGYDAKIEKDKWHTYIFDIAVFKENWSSDLKDFDWNNKYKLWFESTNKDAGTFYVADISVIKNASKSGISVVTNGELIEGSTFSVSFENPNGATGVKIVVKDPNGNVVDSSAVVGAMGNYTVEIYADKYYGTETFRVASKATYPSNVVLNFDVQDQLEKFVVGDGATPQTTTATYLDSFEGATGVAKVTHAHDWPWLSFTPVHDLATYVENGYDRIVFRMFVPEGENSLIYMKLYNDGSLAQLPIGVGQAVVKGEWYDYEFSANYFVNNWDPTNTGLYRLWFFAGKGEGTFYVDSIMMKKTEEIAGDEKTYAKLDATTIVGYRAYSNVGVYVDADAVAADSTLPAIPAGENGYAKLTAMTNAWGVVELHVAPTATYEQFAAADYIEFKYFAPGEGDRRVFMHNAQITTVTAGDWATVRIPMTTFNAAGGYLFKSIREWYDALLNDKTLVNLWELGKEVEATIYVTELRLGQEERNTELGDKYTVLSTENVTVNDGTVTATTFDGKEVIKIESTNTWVNIYIKPGKTIGEIQAYDKIVVTMYIEGDVPVEFYAQDKIYTGADNRFYFYGNENGADNHVAYEAGQWVQVEIPVSHAMQLYSQWASGTNATMIDRGMAFTALYISDITCVKNA